MRKIWFGGWPKVFEEAVGKIHHQRRDWRATALSLTATGGLLNTSGADGGKLSAGADVSFLPLLCIIMRGRDIPLLLLASPRRGCVPTHAFHWSPKPLLSYKMDDWTFLPGNFIFARKGSKAWLRLLSHPLV